MLSILSTITLDSDVVGTTLENEETVLMHMGTARYFTLNATGTQIWTNLGQGLSLVMICEKLVAAYDVNTEQATASILALVEQLAAQDLLVIMDEPVHG